MAKSRASHPGFGFLMNASDSLFEATTSQARWIPCHSCDEWYCVDCRAHAFECDCGALEDLAFDPYTEGKTPRGPRVRIHEPRRGGGNALDGLPDPR
jgi:hypothetical protein